MRRERNKLAATKCRNKKKEKFNLILHKAEAIQKSNNNLRQEMYRLEAEKKHLVRLLMMKTKAPKNNDCKDTSEEDIVEHPEMFKPNTTSEKLDIYSVIENFTDTTLANTI